MCQVACDCFLVLFDLPNLWKSVLLLVTICFGYCVYAGQVLLLPLHIFQSLDGLYRYSLPLVPLLTVAFVHLFTFWSAATCRWSSKCFWASDEDHAIAVWGWSSRLESAEVKPHWKHHVFTCAHCVWESDCLCVCNVYQAIERYHKGIAKVSHRYRKDIAKARTHTHTYTYPQTHTHTLR